MHAVALIFFADFLPSTATSLLQVHLKSIDVMIVRPVEATAITQIEAKSTAEPIPATARTLLPAQNTPSRKKEKNLPTTAGSDASTALPAEMPAYVIGDVAIGKSGSNSPNVITQEGIREYRLNLSREARRYRRYPVSARQRGLEGIVVIAVAARAGLIEPQVGVSRASGQEVLDQQAVEMLGQAVRAANLPESLRGRDFTIDLPIHFSLDQ